MRRFPLLLAATAILLLPSALLAQKRPKDNLSGYDRSARATVLHTALVFVAPDDTSQRVAEVTPGHELVIIEHNGPWLKVYANTDAPDQTDPDKEPEFTSEDIVTPASGWIKDKGVVSPSLAGGDAILFGAAANLEDEASRPHAAKNAASAAHFLYQRVFQYFPTSPLAGEAAFRSADIRWQLEKADISTLPSAKEQEAFLRPQLYEGEMKRVMKLYKGSKYESLAAFDLIDNKLCGDWQGLPKCPDMEAKMYLKFVEHFPDSPKAPEAMFNAVYREGVLVSMYQVDNNKGRADVAAKQTQVLAEEMHTRFPKSDFTPRAQSLAFRVAQGLNIYGSDRE